MRGRRQQENATQAVLQIAGEITQAQSIASLTPSARERIAFCLIEGSRFEHVSIKDLKRLVDKGLHDIERSCNESAPISCKTQAYAVLMTAASILTAASICANKIIMNFAANNKGFYTYNGKKGKVRNHLEVILERMIEDDELTSLFVSKGISLDDLHDINNVITASASNSLLQLSSLEQLLQTKTTEKVELKRPRGRPRKQKNMEIEPINNSNISATSEAVDVYDDTRNSPSETIPEINSPFQTNQGQSIDFESLLKQFE